MATNKAQRAVIYARLSVSSEESVSVARQIESATKYAEVRDWQVVGTFVDDGVSATHNKPEKRKGWRALLDAPEQFDVVVVLKIDRLARRVIDFLHADEDLRARRAAVVSATEPIDMTTAQGRAFATMLAVFAEMEGQAISDRVTGAREYLLTHGRVPGGTVPYGFRTVKNPNGKGKVLAHDDATIGFVKEAVRMVLDENKSVYAVQKYLTENATLPSKSQANRVRTEWHYATVKRILRNPVLAGMTAYNPGNSEKQRGDGVLRQANGMPVVDEGLAIITTEQRRQLLAKLDDKTNPQRMPRADRGATSPLLAGLAKCADCNRTMNRGTTDKRQALYCPKCFQTISMNQLLQHIEKRLLDERGDDHGIEQLYVSADDAISLADVEEAIRNVTGQLATDEADVPALLERLDGLKELRSSARQSQVVPMLTVRKTTVRTDWEAATTDHEHRDVLVSQIKSLKIARGKVGRYLDPSRVMIDWHPANQYEESMAELHSWMKPGDIYAEAELTA